MTGACGPGEGCPSPSRGCSEGVFGYVRPPLELLAPEESARFRRAYCGLCHALGERYGPAARMILNYDFTYLAILLSERTEPDPLRSRWCVQSSPEAGPISPPPRRWSWPRTRASFWPGGSSGMERRITASGRGRATGRPPPPWAAPTGRPRRPGRILTGRSAPASVSSPPWRRSSAPPWTGRRTPLPEFFRAPPPPWRTRSAGGCWSRCSTTWAGGCTWWTRRTTCEEDAAAGGYNPVALRYGLAGRKMDGGEPARPLPRRWTSRST